MIMRTGLVFVLLLCLCTHSSNQECRQELEEGVMFSGTHIKLVFSPDVHHCQQMCTQHPSCLFFYFFRRSDILATGHHCYLWKTSSGEPDKREPFPTAIAGYSLKACPHISAPCFDQVYTDTEFSGSDYRTLFTAGYEECQKACTQDPGCQFFTWVNSVYSDPKIRYKCHLKFSWTVPVTPIVEKVSDVVSGFSHHAEISTSNNFFRECQSKYLPGIDIPGSNLFNTPAASPEHCHILCSAHPSCTYFSYQGTTCFLKNNPNEMVTVAKEGVTSGLPSRFCQQDKSWLRSTYEGIDFKGSDLMFVLLDDAESCQRACTDNPNCLFYTYVTSAFTDPVHRRRCYLKRVITIPSPSKVEELPNVVSGFSLKNCARNSTGSFTV